MLFDKIDGSNIRVEWRPKNGFYKFGSRTRLIGTDQPFLTEAIDINYPKSQDNRGFQSRKDQDSAVKTWTLKQMHIVRLNTVNTFYQVYEFEKEGKNFFYYNEGQQDNSFPWDNDLFRVIFYHSRNLDGKQYRKLARARNLLEAQAELVEMLIAQNCALELNHWTDGDYPLALMKEFDKSDLPLLINFFNGSDAIKAFEEVLKE